MIDYNGLVLVCLGIESGNIHIQILADLRNAGDHALLILGDQRQLRIKGLVLRVVCIPADIDETCPLLRRQGLQIVTVFSMNGNTAAFGG